MKKFILIGVTALAALGIMSGCSSNNKKEASSPLTFWYMGDGDQGVKPIIDKFTKETGVAVKIQSIPWSASRDKLLTAVAAKNGPDVAQIGTSFMSEFVDAGALTDISDDVKKTDVLKPTNFFDGSVATTKFDSKYYAVPWYTETRALYYRTDLLNAVGYPQAPKTWEELADAAKKLANRGDNMYGINIDAAEPTFGFMFARQNGSTLFDKQNKPLFNQPEMVNALKYLEDIVKSGASPKTNLGLDISQSFGGKGIVPMFISGPWMISGINENATDIKGKWAVAELPKGPVNGESVTGGANLAVFSSSKKKADSMKLIEYLSKKENQTAFFKSTNSLPTNKAAWQSETFTKDPIISVFGKQLEHSQPMPLLKKWDETTQLYMKQWEQVISKGKDIKKAMTELDDDTIKLNK